MLQYNLAFYFDILNNSQCINYIYSPEAFLVAQKHAKIMDHAGIFETVCVMVKNLNAIIDRNEYPNSESKLSNMLNRPLGIGIQGLADLYFQMRLPFDSKEADQVNKELFETMYYAALWASSDLAHEQYNKNKRNNTTFAQDKLMLLCPFPNSYMLYTDKNRLLFVALRNQ